MTTDGPPATDPVPADRGELKTQQHLRKVAEARIAEPRRDLFNDMACTPEQIVHELRVHQIELEMQNDALREAQQSLAESRDRYADLYEFAPVGYLTITSKGLIEEANLTCATILGVERRKLVRARFSRYVAADNEGVWYQYFTGLMSTGEKKAFEIQLRRGNGTVFIGRLESFLVQQEHREPVIRLAMSDVTDRVLAEENLALKSQDLDELHVAYKTIAEGQEKLRQNESRLSVALEEKEVLLYEVRHQLVEQKRTDAALTEREKDLKQLLAEKEVLLSEIHHRVKNNLTAFISLLSLEGSYEDTPAGTALRKDLQNRARTMALIHETLYKTQKYSEVDMEVYLSNLTDQVVASYCSTQYVKAIVDAKGVTIDLARATPIGLIINELVTNSLKYAFPLGAVSCHADQNDPCTVAIRLTKENGNYLLRVSDNGIGLPAGFNITKTTTLGLKLVSFLAKHQVRAKIEVNSGKGTEFVFRFDVEPQ